MSSDGPTPSRSGSLARRVAPLAAAVVAFGCGAGLIAGGLLGPARNLPALDAAAVARGDALYAGLCLGCHGWSGGQAPPLDATGHAWRHSDAQLARIIASGTGEVGNQPVAMPGFAAQLGQEETTDLVAYLKSRWPAELRQQQAVLNPGSEAALSALLTDPSRILPGNCPVGPR